MRISGARNCQICVRRRGEILPLCVFIHGTADGSYVWNDLLSRMPDRAVATIDLRGHGDSDWDPRGAYRGETFVDDVNRVLNALSPQAVVLVGHSLGAAIAIQLASMDRRVGKLVVVDFGPGMTREGLERAGDQFRELVRTYSSVSEYADLLTAERPLLTREKVDALALDALRKRADGMFELKCDPALAHRPDDPVLPDSILLAQLRGITCPTMIVRGSGSASFPFASAQRMVKEMKNAELRNVPMAGHAVMLDNPEGFAEAALPFLMTS